MSRIFDDGLPKTPANYLPLTPIAFLERAASVYPTRTAVVYGSDAHSWAELAARSKRLASALVSSGVASGCTVAVMLPNVPAMVEAHFGVPMAGAVLNALNTRLDAESIAYMLDHGEASAVIVDTEYLPLMNEAIRQRRRQTSLLLLEVADPAHEPGRHRSRGAIGYEDFLAGGDPAYEWRGPADEWDAIALNYTSGTTGVPKGVVYHHRGAVLNAVSNVLEWDMPRHPVFLWTLPMFHCNGWCFPWTLAARAGVNVCLRRVEASAIIDAMKRHGVTHYCGAPVVHGMILAAPDAEKAGIPCGIKGMVAGAAPPATMIEGMEKLGIELTHVYGLTEVYGPAAVCAVQSEWEQLGPEGKARMIARQGVRYHLQGGIDVLDPATMAPVPHDGETVGEIMFKGNIAMKGYLKDRAGTEKAFGHGWFHTGDLGVKHRDGYIKIKDRAKDIIISGGENISSIEIEDVLYSLPEVMVAAVVAHPDPKWGETPCAVIELKPGASLTADAVLAHCRERLAGFKVPRRVVFRELPKTSTGKVQKAELRKQLGSALAIDV